MDQSINNKCNPANLFVKMYLRYQYGLFDSEISERTGFGRQHVNAVLNGRSKITNKFADALEREFGIDAASLLSFQAVGELNKRRDLRIK